MYIFIYMCIYIYIHTYLNIYIYMYTRRGMAKCQYDLELQTFAEHNRLSQFPVCRGKGLQKFLGATKRAFSLFYIF